MLIPADRLDEEPKILEQLKRGERVDHFETIRVRKDGSQLNISLTISPVKDANGRIIGASKVAHDITDRKQAEKASALLSAIVDSSDDAIISKDLNGVITSWNKGAERLFGYTAEETVGRPVTMLIPADRLDEEVKILEQLKRGERVDHFETIRVRKDGSQLNISLTISPVKDADGRIIGASKVARDITDRILTEKALREYAEQLKDADQRKDEFLATLAHELRNPLAPILNAVGLLKRPNLTAENFQMAREIAESQLNQMVRLVDDLLDISRISRGKIELKKERVTLKSILDQALETSRPHVEAAGHKLSLSLPPGNVYLDGDPLRLAQVLSNLINNACKYSANNGTIEIKAEVETEIENKGNQRDAPSTEAVKRLRQPQWNWSSPSKTRVSASHPSICRGFSNCSHRSTRRWIAPRADWASACRWCAVWLNSMAAASKPAVKDLAKAVNSSCACRQRPPPWKNQRCVPAASLS